MPVVHQQGGALRGPAQHVGLLQQVELVAADEARAGHQVGGPDRPRTETQVGHRLRAGLLRVVDEIALREEVLLGAEDLDGVLVGADGAVRPEAEEHRTHAVRRLDVQRRVVADAGAGDVVVDADGEPVARVLAGEFGVDPGDHPGGELLGGQAVPGAGHPRHDRQRAVGVGVVQRGHHVQEQRFRRSSPAPWCGPARRSWWPSAAGHPAAPAPGTAGTAGPGSPRPARPGRSAWSRCPAPSATRTPSAPPPARPRDARCTRRCPSAGRCARPADPSGPARPSGCGRRTGSPSRAPGSRCPGSARCRG